MTERLSSWADSFYVILSRLCEGSRLYLRRCKYPPQYSTRTSLKAFKEFIVFLAFVFGGSIEGGLLTPSNDGDCRSRINRSFAMTSSLTQSLREGNDFLPTKQSRLYVFGESIEGGPLTPSKDEIGAL